MKFINRMNYNVHMKNSLEQRIFSVITWAYTAEKPVGSIEDDITWEAE